MDVVEETSDKEKKIQKCEEGIVALEYELERLRGKDLKREMLIVEKEQRLQEEQQKKLLLEAS